MQNNEDPMDSHDDEVVGESAEIDEPNKNDVNRIQLSDIKKRAQEKLDLFASEEGTTAEMYEKYRSAKKAGNLGTFDEGHLEACRRIDRRYASEAAESIANMRNFVNPLAAEMAKISEAMGKNMMRGVEIPKMIEPKVKFSKPNIVWPGKGFHVPKTSLFISERKGNRSYKSSDQYLARKMEESDILTGEPSTVSDELLLHQEMIEKNNKQIELIQAMVDIMTAEAEASKVRDNENKLVNAKMLAWSITAALAAIVGAITAIASGIIKPPM